MRHSAYKRLYISFHVVVLMLFSGSWVLGQTSAGLPYASSEASPQLGYGMNNTNGQSPFLGSVPSGKPTGKVIHLSIKDAIRLGLKYNLGLVESDLNTRTARAERLKELSHLMPNINATLSQSVQQINLKAMGINFPGVPVTVGPFGVQDARGYLSQTVLDWNAIQKLRASRKRVQASQFSYQNSRDIVVLAVGNAYLKVVSDAATVDSQKAQLNTSQALHDRAVDKLKAGLSAQIDEMRAKVELQTQQQR